MINIGKWENKDFKPIELQNDKGIIEYDGNFIWKGVVFSGKHKELVEKVQLNMRDNKGNNKIIPTHAAIKLLHATGWDLTVLNNKFNNNKLFIGESIIKVN
eukprot:309184_1